MAFKRHMAAKAMMETDERTSLLKGSNHIRSESYRSWGEQAVSERQTQIIRHWKLNSPKPREFPKTMGKKKKKKDRQAQSLERILQCFAVV